ncbi:hypothetical protein [Nostoc sp.]|uniref:hypothetical protein n=1 Tax=Nostoc sp. TaxID=1180 RepID=UPI002FFC5C1E
MSVLNGNVLNSLEPISFAQDGLLLKIEQLESRVRELEEFQHNYEVYQMEPRDRGE